MIRVAALYIDPGGPYPRLPNVECWGLLSVDDGQSAMPWGLAHRDARLYEGPHPVVAHPPCGPWGSLRHLYKGDEWDCGPIAVEQVRRFGGVLEHPARSRLWEHCGLPTPGLVQAGTAFSVAVDQCDFGHVARKKTWLYLVGIPREAVIFPPKGKPTHWVTGFRSTTHRNVYAKTGSAVPEGIKVCSAQQRRRTPPAFARWLVDLAADARNIIENEKGESGDG
jgi:hypothetical protein